MSNRSEERLWKVARKKKNQYGNKKKKKKQTKKKVTTVADGLLFISFVSLTKKIARLLLKLVALLCFRL